MMVHTLHLRMNSTELSQIFLTIMLLGFYFRRPVAALRISNSLALELARLCVAWVAMSVVDDIRIN